MAKEKVEKEEVEVVAHKKGNDLSSLSEKELKLIAKPEAITKIGEPEGPRNKRQMAAVIELYRRKNPAKYEVKRVALEAQLALLPD